MKVRYTRLFRYAFRHWRVWAVIVTVTFSSTVVSVLQPWPMKVLVDHVLGSQPLTGVLANIAQTLPHTGTRYALLTWVVIATLILFVLSSLFDVLLTVSWTRVGRRMVYDLASDLFARVQRRSLPFHARHPVGDSMSRIAVDSWSVHTVVDTLLFAPGHALFALVVTLAIMFRLDAGLTMVALGVAPLMAGSARLFGRPIRTAARAKREIESRIQSHVHQVLSGIPVVQAFSREEAEHRRFREFADGALRAERRTILASRAFSFGSGLTTTLCTAAVLWLASRRVLDGRLSLGTALVFIAYLHSLQSQLGAFGNIYKTMQGAGASIDRVNDILDHVDDLGDTRGAPALPPVRGHVQLENVTFGYDPSRPILKNVSLEARPGERIALVGATGSGKSTLMALIPRFVDPWTGRVAIDGMDLRNVRIRSVRDQVVLVFQDPFLFPLSIADNIAYGRPDATRAEIEAAARAASAHDFIARLPEGYDTVLGERGATLSGGERQRLSIARAFLKNAPILILDEPTSALDGETEASLMDALDRLMAGRTTFIVAHRLSTVRSATRIAVMKQGVIVEQGSHDELLERDGAYAALYRQSWFDESALQPTG